MKKPCRICGASENGYYTEKSRTCKKCNNIKVMQKQKEWANEQGYKNYYQLQKFQTLSIIIDRNQKIR
jgi:hypothetical protein